MTAEHRYIVIAILCALLASCSGASCSGGHRYGVIFIKAHYIPPNTLSALRPCSLPQNADSVSITITGTDFSPIVKAVHLAASPSGTTIDNIPAGFDRTVSVEVRDASSHRVARGMTTGVRIKAGGINDVNILITPTGVFTQLTSKVIPRAFARSASLPDGTYIIMGGIIDRRASCGQGCTRLAATDTTEIYHPDTGMFAQGPRMTEGRVFFTASRLADGSIMLAGGAGSAAIGCSDGACSISVSQDDTKTSLEVYDPKSNSFYKAGTMAFPRAGHTADVLAGDVVLIAGGIGPGGPTREAELLGLYTDKDTVYVMGAARAFHASAACAGDAVLIAGGSSSGNTEFFQSAGFAASDSITLTTSFLASAVLPVNSDVLVNGGFDPGWVPVNRSVVVDPDRRIVLGYYSMHLPRALFSDILIGNGDVLIVGGVTTPAFTATDSAEIFSTVSRSFVGYPQLSVPRAGYTGMGLADGSVLIASGFSSVDLQTGMLALHDSAEVYNP